MIVLFAQTPSWQAGGFFLCLLSLYNRKKKQIYIYNLLFFIYFLYIYMKNFYKFKKQFQFQNRRGHFQSPAVVAGGGCFLAVSRQIRLLIFQFYCV